MYLYISFTNKVALVFSGCFPHISHCLPVRFLTLWYIKIRWLGSTCEHLVMTAQPHLTLQRKVMFHNHCYPHCCSNFSNWSLNVHIYMEHHFTRTHTQTPFYGHLLSKMLTVCLLDREQTLCIFGHTKGTHKYTNSFSLFDECNAIHPSYFMRL